jgi:LysM repeat protein
VAPWVAEGPAPQAGTGGGGGAITTPPTPTQDPILRLLPPTRLPGEPFLTPTPDAIRPEAPVRTQAEVYVVQPGDSLGQIAGRYNVSPNAILAANTIVNPNILPVGMVLVIPAPVRRDPGPSFKILPDSELVNGPGSARFDLAADIASRGGALSRYSEEIDGRDQTGVEIVQAVARSYSVSPRLLLAVLEFQSGWLTQAQPSAATRPYPIGFVSRGREGLFSQLSWAADQMNSGYYRWRAGWAGPFVTAEGASVPPGPGINAGTAGVQYLFSLLYASDAWRQVVGEGGFYQTYVALFGNPFDRAVEPLLPPNLVQPSLQLPFENGKVWSFTGGPHSAWDAGAAWAALDFAPPGYALGCVTSEEWVTAVADGLILRADQGEVIEDLDGDGYEGTGWDILYMHVEARDRILPGAFVHAGDRIGHPSCEGGVSNGTHLHVARKYNGEWIPADGNMPFVMDDWVSAGAGWEYDGTMARNGVTLEACSCRAEGNQISR